jgi:hypothetical protein
LNSLPVLLSARLVTAKRWASDDMKVQDRFAGTKRQTGSRRSTHRNHQNGNVLLGERPRKLVLPPVDEILERHMLKRMAGGLWKGPDHVLDLDSKAIVSISVPVKKLELGVRIPRRIKMGRVTMRYLPSKRSRVQNKITEVKVREVMTEGLGEERAEEGFADELLAWAEGGRESEEGFVVSGEPVGDVVG